MHAGIWGRNIPGRGKGGAGEGLKNSKEASAGSRANLREDIVRRDYFYLEPLHTKDSREHVLLHPEG